MKLKKIDDKGGSSLVLVIVCLILMSVAVYNVNIVKTSYSTVDYKHKLDSIAKKNLINAINLDDLRDYKFGNGTIYYQYNDTSNTITKNFNTATPAYVNFRNSLVSSIENEFSGELFGIVNDIEFDTSRVDFNYSHLESNVLGIDKYVITLSYKYVAFIEVPINEHFPIEVDTFILNDSDVSSGKITVTKNADDPGIANVAISGKVAIRYSINRRPDMPV